jgi:RNA polymerase sigma-70 factor (ECF subfamily)
MCALNEHREFVMRLARHLGRGRVDPEDLAQDVLERWLRCSPRAGSIHNPQAWMAVVLRRLLIDRMRRRHAAREVPVDAATPLAAEREARPWWRELDDDAVERELSTLPAALRETFQLFTFEARSYEQIARDLKIAKGTVGTRISRARALLKQRLIEHCAPAAVPPAAASDVRASPSTARGRAKTPPMTFVTMTPEERTGAASDRGLLDNSERGRVADVARPRASSTTPIATPSQGTFR